MSILHAISMSGGKDSTATAILASWRGEGTFFPAPEDGHGKLRGHGIRAYVEWAKTSFGGRQYDMAHLLIDGDACSSAYGLCE